VAEPLIITRAPPHKVFEIESWNLRIHEISKMTDQHSRRVTPHKNPTAISEIFLTV